MTDAELLAKLSRRDVVGLTLWGEARGEEQLGRFAVASVIGNRVAARRRHWGLDHKAVCLAPHQFSCWTKDPHGNHDTLMAAAHSLSNPKNHVGPVMRDCLAIADELLAGRLPDVTNGSTHYLRDFLYRSESCPAWAKGKTPAAVINGHLFFSGIQ